jgi:predicted transposase YbfD/YdcC
VVLGQRKIDEKSNETTTALERLNAVATKGAVVTIDSMRCQKRERITARTTYYKSKAIKESGIQQTSKIGEKWQAGAPLVCLKVSARDETGKTPSPTNILSFLYFFQ